jgi:non-canonical poly(A) RNA polymerase PAPD5/7
VPIIKFETVEYGNLAFDISFDVPNGPQVLPNSSIDSPWSSSLLATRALPKYVLMMFRFSQAAVLVKEVIHDWPMIKPLVLVLKLFLQQRELNEVEKRYTSTNCSSSLLPR